MKIFKFSMNEYEKNTCPDCKCKTCCDQKIFIDIDGIEWDCHDCADRSEEIMQ